ncbi:MAG: preprotein translocase subunit SecG [Phycisphaerae bacterium]
MISAILFALFSMLLMIVVLLQRGKGVGLAGAFGGAGGTAAFGTKTGDMLTWITIVMFAIFIMLAVGLNFLFAAGKATISAPVPVASENAPLVETQIPESGTQSPDEPTITVTPTQTDAPPAAEQENTEVEREPAPGEPAGDPATSGDERGALRFPATRAMSPVFA